MRTFRGVGYRRRSAAEARGCGACRRCGLRAFSLDFGASSRGEGPCSGRGAHACASREDRGTSGGEGYRPGHRACVRRKGPGTSQCACGGAHRQGPRAAAAAPAPVAKAPASAVVPAPVAKAPAPAVVPAPVAKAPALTAAPAPVARAPVPVVTPAVVPATKAVAPVAAKALMPAAATGPKSPSVVAAPAPAIAPKAPAPVAVKSVAAAALPVALAPAPSVPMAVSPKPAPELDQMKILEGNWRCDGRAPSGPMGPEHAYKSTWKFKRDLDNFWWAAEYKQTKAKANPMPMKARGYLTYDPSTKGFIMVGVDNAGGSTVESTTGWSGDVVTLAGDASLAGKKIPFREVITKRGTHEFTWRGEVRTGGDWVTLGEDRCKK